MKLALGTAQFGMPYGISNTVGQINEVDAQLIIKRSEDIGINTIDTAVVYGESELCLGHIGIGGWRVITKLPEVPANCLSIDTWVREQLKNSFNRLCVKNVTGLMLHRPMQLSQPMGSELWHVLLELKHEGLVEKIGYSIYSPDEIGMLWPKFIPDIIQSPYNVLDQRLKTSGWLKRLHDRDVEVHVRSVFLQGLLLMGQETRPEKFKRWNNVWSQWEEWLKINNFSALEGCLLPVLLEEMINFLVVGVNSLQDLNEILAVATQNHDVMMPETLSIDDDDLINPSKW